jgi:hypothetical protein
MPVHHESAMMGEARESIERQVREAGITDGNSAGASGKSSGDVETEDRGLKMKALGVVMGRSASSRRKDGGSSSSSSSESEDSDCKTAKGLGCAN